MKSASDQSKSLRTDSAFWHGFWSSFDPLQILGSQKKSLTSSAGIPPMLQDANKLREDARKAYGAMIHHESAR